MSPEQDLREMLWRAADLLRRDSAEVSLPCLLTIVGLKMLSDSAERFRHEGYRVPDSVNWHQLKRNPQAAQAVLQALHALTVNPSWRFLGEIDPTWLVREDVLSQLMLLVDTVDLALDGETAGRPLGHLIDRVMEDMVSKDRAEHQTPVVVNDLMAALLSWDGLSGGTLYDPACGVGGTLVATWSRAEQAGVDPHAFTLMGQDISVRALYLATWNLLLHGVVRFQLTQGDVLDSPGFLSNEGARVQTFDRVVATPPLGLQRPVAWGPDPYQRFRYGDLRGRRADFGFVQHILASMNTAGQAVMLLPAGPLFRAGFEQDIRRNLVQADVLDAVITLPAGSLADTGVSSTILVFRQHKAAERQRVIRMVDASKAVGAGDRAILDGALVRRIIRAAQAVEDEAGFARSVSADEIASREWTFVPSAYLVEPFKLTDPAGVAAHIAKDEAVYDQARRVLTREIAQLAEVLRQVKT